MTRAIPAVLAMAAMAGLALAGPGNAAAPQPNPPTRICAAETTYQALEADTVKQLSANQLWINPNQRNTLDELIRTAGTLRLQAAIPILIEHLDFAPDPEMDRMKPIPVMFPAAGALIQIGLPAVPALLEVVKADPGKEWEAGRGITIALVTMRDIYEQGADGNQSQKQVLGKAMARYRIQLAMEGSTPEVAARLKHFLDVMPLKPSSDLDYAVVQPEGVPPLFTAPERVTGLGVSPKEAALKADLIAVAVADQVSDVDPSAFGIADCTAHIAATRFLKGNLKEAKFALAFKIKLNPNEEVVPKAKGSYLFFLKGDKPDTLEVIKILDDTEANRAAVAQALAAEPGGEKK